ncbi:MAG: hypothetical protein FGM21_01235 [Limnohabitans sp.]|jgi:protein-tyrosine phosphatase|nr:hypothetical protein [Limnohabitans sp.]
MYKILFVCMGNICRSPTAQAVMQSFVDKAHLTACILVDSAGTHAYHAGAQPDGRSQRHASLRGYSMSSLQARQISPPDFEQADLILAMDWDNLALLQAQCPPAMMRKVRRMAEFFQTHPDTVVPDPYEGGAAGFEKVLDLVEDACQGLLAHLLTPDALARNLPEWRLLSKPSALEREFEFGHFLDAMAFVQRVAVQAHAQQHHPEIWNVYHRVRMTLTTHDANGLTLKDLALAHAIQECLVAS